MNPSVALCVSDTHVSTTAMTGAEQGAATSPDAAPMIKVPARRPPFPAVAAEECAGEPREQSERRVGEREAHDVAERERHRAPARAGAGAHLLSTHDRDRD